MDSYLVSQSLLHASIPYNQFVATVSAPYLFSSTPQPSFLMFLMYSPFPAGKYPTSTVGPKSKPQAGKATASSLPVAFLLPSLQRPRRPQVALLAKVSCRSYAPYSPLLTFQCGPPSCLSHACFERKISFFFAAAHCSDFDDKS